ncbi:MAG: TonB-dependent receptor [Gemmatimonadetes bacterium]|nr:TonB-dependent receptor [Gemmatimonadota bacterium]MBI3567665.1 TonB-dependent receptor [Gemmatimonadota bacterium]
MIWKAPSPLLRLALLAVTAIAPGRAVAQSISGSVRSAGTPVVGATVRLLEGDRVLRTGAGGAFAFQSVSAGRYTLFVAATGYASTSRQVTVGTAPATVQFDLVPSALPLKEVVVSASPVARTSDDQVQSVATKGLRELQDSWGTSFAEKLSDVPGVTVRANGSAPSRPILRGLGDNEVLILENGLRMGDIATYDPAHATPLLALGIAQADVVRGPATILYGPSTIGGVVNVITDLVPAVADRPVSGTASVEANSVSDEYAAHARTVFSGANQAFSVSGGLLRAHETRIPSGIYTDPGTGARFALDRMPQTFDQSNEVGAGYAVQGAFGSFGLGVKHHDMNYGIPGVPPNADWANVPPTTSRIAQRRTTLEARGLFNVGGSFVRAVKLNANYNDYTHSEYPTAQDATGVSDPQANHFHKRQFNGVLQLQQQPVGAWSGTLGLWTNVEDLAIEGDQPLGPNSLTTGVAAYAYEEYAASSATRLQGGLRFDYSKIQTRPYAQSTDSVFQSLDVSREHTAFTASLGAVTQFTPEVTGSFSVARSFRVPTVQELFANGLDAASGTYSVGTAGLGPEQGFGIDASLKGNFKRVAFEVSPYVNLIHDYIYGFLRGDTIQDFPVRQFAATDARLAGFEASATVLATPLFAIRASADYVNAEDTKRNEPLPFTPPLRGLLRGTYQDQTWMAMAEVRAASSQTRLGEGDTPTDGYAVVNAGFGWRYVQGGVVHNITLRVDNVLNAVYRDNLSVIKDFLPQPARGVRLNYQLLY